MLDQQRLDFEDEHCISFDLMQVQPLPYLNVNKAFYNRKMWMFNFGIHHPKTKHTYIYTWNENDGYRGSVEICTALYKHIKKHHSAADHLILWSDYTGGQNRNHMMTTIILRLLTEIPELKYVVNRFPIVGHSFLPNDRDFGVIANAKKKKQCLYDSAQYIKMIEEARKNPHPIQVIKMKPRNFVSFEDTA